MVKKENRGRKRLPEKEKKISVQLYIEQHRVDRFGGIRETKLEILNYLAKHDRKLQTKG